MASVHYFDFNFKLNLQKQHSSYQQAVNNLSPAVKLIKETYNGISVEYFHEYYDKVVLFKIIIRNLVESSHLED